MTTFSKYQGLGNDFLLVDRRGVGNVTAELTRAVCDRHLGVGADGIIALMDAERARPELQAERPDAIGRPFMRVFNADGSVADMCGNGLRCFVRWLIDEQGFEADALVVETDAGPQPSRPLMEGPRVVAVAVDLGQPRFAAPKLLQSADRTFEGHDLFLGNPHYVIEAAPRDADEPGLAGPGLSTHSAFPHGTNVEWLEIIDRRSARVTVYERGVGLTQACGTGGGGAAACGVRLGRLDPDVDLTIVQPGGALTYRVAADFSSVWMTGPAEPVFRGTWPSDW